MRGSRWFIAHDGMHRHVKYWIKPDIENRIKNGEIKAYFNTDVVEITQDAVVIEDSAGDEDDQERFCVCDDGISSRLQLS